MILADLTWPDVEALDRDLVVLLPTGSLEQHGAHLPLFTDSIIAGSVAEEVEKLLTGQVLLTPPLWLGASGHHLAFPGTLSASFEGYIQALESVVESMIRHGFHRFFVLNGHGGNTDLNSIACRKLKERNRTLTIGHAGWFEFLPAGFWDTVLEGPVKTIRHACEAETSVMLYLRPELVRMAKARVDGLAGPAEAKGLVWMFDEATEAGSWGHAPLGTAAKGEAIFEAAVEGAVKGITAIHDGIVLLG